MQVSAVSRILRFNQFNANQSISFGKKIKIHTTEKQAYNNKNKNMYQLGLLS